MKFQQLALLSAFLLAVSAKVKITNPVKDTVWEFGKKNTVNWKHSDQDKGKVDINLFYTKGVDPEKFRGKPVASMTIDDVTKDTAEFDLSKLDVDQFPPSVEQYFLRFGDVNGSYSHLFTIKGGKGSESKPSDGNSSNSNSGSNGSNDSNASNNNNGNNANSGDNANNGNNANNANNGNNGNNANNANNGNNGNNANNANNGDNANNANNANNGANGANNTTVANGGNTANNANNANGQTTVPANNTATNGANANQGNTVNQGNNNANSDASGVERTIATSFFAVVAAVAAFLF